MPEGQSNPFKPTAGATPPLLIGRQGVLDELTEGLDDGPGAPARLTIFTGARGVGKTVMLAEAGHQARRRSWVVVDETATPGLLDRLHAAVISAHQDLDPSPRPGRAVTGVTVTGLGAVQLAPPEQPRELQLRQALDHLLDQLEAHGTGLLITVDEVHRAARDDLRGFAATYQHLVREQRNVALALAGLPAAVSDLLKDDVLTFLRRADRHVLADVSPDDVARAFQDTITASGRTIEPDALSVAATATAGYPFMVQLVGYHVWRKAEHGVIDQRAARAGIAAARVRLGSTVHAANLASLSDVDRTFLLAMAQDPGPSKVSDVAARMGRDAGYTSVYRSRLLAAGVIRSVSYGRVDFAVPYLREHLREHAATGETGTRTAGGTTPPTW